MVHAAPLPAGHGAPPVHPDSGCGGGGPPLGGGGLRLGGSTRPLEAAVPALLLVAGALLPPDRPFPFDLCLWHRLTGFDCLGCGLTRSVSYMMHGDIARSLALHPAGVIVAAIIAVLAVRGAREAARGFGSGLTRRG